MPIRHSLQADHLTKIKWSAAFYPFVRPLFYSVHPSTITREVQRNSNRDNQYVFTIAQRKCESRKHSILGNHRKDETLWWRVEQMIKDEDWSPRQIRCVLAVWPIMVMGISSVASRQFRPDRSIPVRERELARSICWAVMIAADSQLQLNGIRNSVWMPLAIANRPIITSLRSTTGSR